MVDIFGLYNASEDQKNKTFTNERDEIVSRARPNDVYKIYGGNYDMNLSYMKVVINGSLI